MLKASGVASLNRKTNKTDTDTGAHDAGVTNEATNGKANECNDLKKDSKHQSSKKSSRS
jgi:hypothetical protein